MWARQYSLMEAASDGAGGSGAGAVGAGDGGSAPAGSAGAAAPAAGSPAAPSSALAAGASAQPAASGPASFIPTKFQVKDGDALNVEASLAKWQESYGHLERRLVAGDSPPKDPGEYKVDKLPEGAPAWDEFKAAPENASFLKSAHAKGMTNAQLEFVLGEFYTRAPALVEGARALDADGATTALREVWKDEPVFSTNMQHAFRAAQAAAQKAGVPFAELESAIGNNPVALRALAALGADMREGQSLPPGAAPSAESVETLMASEAYWNERHPEHKRVSEKVRVFYQSKFPGKSL